MDPTKKSPTVLSVCTGYGGIERGVSQVIGNLTPIAYVEVEAFACQNLVQKMETRAMAPAPIWTDVKTFPALTVRDAVDVLVGGYPCQPFSNAGLRLGTADDPRHLWPYIRRIIRIAQPKLCFFENVEGHINRGLEQVLNELEAEGYRTTWGIFSAAEVGAPHIRKRIFIMGDRGFDWEYYMADANGGRQQQSPRRQREERDGVVDGGQDVADALQSGLEGHRGDEQEERRPGAGKNRSSAPSCLPLRWPARPGQEQHNWEEPRLVTKFKRGG